VLSSRLPAGTDPQAAYGEGSGTENNDALSTLVEAGQDNFVYLRVRNRGDQAVVDGLAQVTVYWSEVATLVTPASWHRIGQVGMDVPLGNVLTVSETIVWPKADIPSPGHYCFVATAGTPNDPVPSLANLADINSFVAFVRDNNNVTWRNFNVVDLQAMVINPEPQPFVIAGAPEEDVEMGLEVIAELPDDARLVLEAPAGLLERFPQLKLEIDGERARATLRPTGRQDLGFAEFPAGMRAAAQLHVELPEEALKGSGWTVAIRQYATADRLEVGRVTWHFAAPERRDRPEQSYA
jgi:serine protease